MNFVVFCFIVIVFAEAGCAPIDGKHPETNAVNNLGIDKNVVSEDTKGEDSARAAPTENPVQQWFEDLSKNASTNTQNALNNIRDWFSTIANGAQAQNLPTMYMGSFQVLKMPVPQISDVVSGLGNLATVAQTINKVTGIVPPGIPGLT